MRSCRALLLAALLSLMTGYSSLQAQVFVTLSTLASPSSGQPGVTTINITGSGFPGGSILPANTTIALQPSAGGTIATTSASAVTTIIGSTRRVTFSIPPSISLSASTAYKVTVTGQTTASTAFATANGNWASLTINPPASISQVNPNGGSVGQSVSVTITGSFTNFVQGSTKARFGPDIAVGGAAQGTFGPVTVTSATSATANLVISGIASIGAVSVDVRTGVQQSSQPNGFSIAALALTGIKEYIYFNGKPLTVEQGIVK